MIACVDSVDSESFYAKNRHPAERIRRHDQYDHYLAHEVVPFARSKARTTNRVATLGASSGKSLAAIPSAAGVHPSHRRWLWIASRAIRCRM